MSLMTMPAKIRLKIWQDVIPEEIALERIGFHHPHRNDSTDGDLDSNGGYVPQNPHVALILIYHKALGEVTTAPQTILAASFTYGRLRRWLWHCSGGCQTVCRRLIISSRLAFDASDNNFGANVMLERDRFQGELIKLLDASYRNVAVAYARSTPDSIYRSGYVSAEFEVAFSVSEPRLDSDRFKDYA